MAEHSSASLNRVARNLFAFLFLSMLVVLVTWVAILLSPVPDNLLFSQIRTAIVVGLGIVGLVNLAVLVRFFRKSPDELTESARPVTSVIGNRLFSWILPILLLEMIFFAFLTLTYVAPTITGPLKFLLVCWSFLIAALIVLVHLEPVRGVLRATSAIRGLIGLSVIVVVVLVALYFVTDQIVSLTRVEELLRGGLDTRPLVFIDDGETPRPQDFWAEQAQTSVQWMPYLYWTVAPFDGDYINIATNGVRYTPDYVESGNSDTAKQIYFFGGSTMWGEGARDAYTIPGHVARLLRDAQNPQLVVNYGQTGYVSTQDMMTFQFLLANGNQPDVAVFYQGFNDVFSAYLQDLVGIPLRESNRISDVEAGRQLRAGYPVLKLPDASLSEYDWSLVATERTAEAVVDRWIANAGMLRAIAGQFDVQLVFVWQPSLIYKDVLVGDEAVIKEKMAVNYPGLTEFYGAVDDVFRERLESTGWTDVIMLSELFENDERAVFHDLVHITEEGNLAVAEAILDSIVDTLSKD